MTPRLSPRHPWPTVAALAAALASALAVPAAAGVAEVRFVDSDRYADIGRTVAERQRAMDALRAHFDTLAQRLPEGQTLKVDVLDVDLAGEQRFTRHANDLRILKGRADWPRIRMHYEVLAQGKAVKSGDADIADMSYLDFSARLPDTGPLAYERRLLDEWFAKQVLLLPAAP